MLIPDLLKARPEDLDLELIERKLWNLRRFQGHPDALDVRPHSMLVQHLAIRDNAPDEVIEWCYHHDDHEGLTGDANGLLIQEVNKETSVWETTCYYLDSIICTALKIQIPKPSTRIEVHRYDKLAESLETTFGLGWPRLAAHPEWPEWLDFERAESMFNWAKAQKAELYL